MNITCFFLHIILLQAAEQLFSWVKGYSKFLSALGWRKMPIYLLVLFHHKNLKRVNIRPTQVFNIASFAKHLSLHIHFF